MNFVENKLRKNRLNDVSLDNGLMSKTTKYFSDLNKLYSEIQYQKFH